MYNFVTDIIKLQYDKRNLNIFHDGMEIPFEDWSKKLHSFNDLTSIIQTTHDAAQSSAVKAINRMQTMRN